MKSQIQRLQKNKIKLLALLFVAAIAMTTISCSGDDEEAPVTNPTTGTFTATIGTENFSTNDTYLFETSAGGTQAFTATGADGRVFSSAIFPSQFPLNEPVNISFSGSITYKVGEVLYIPNSGTMTFSIIEPYQRLRGTFNGTFVSGDDEIAISGEFDISN